MRKRWGDTESRQTQPRRGGGGDREGGDGQRVCRTDRGAQGCKTTGMQGGAGWERPACAEGAGVQSRGWEGPGGHRAARTADRPGDQLQSPWPRRAWAWEPQGLVFLALRGGDSWAPITQLPTGQAGRLPRFLKQPPSGGRPCTPFPRDQPQLQRTCPGRQVAALGMSPYTGATAISGPPEWLRGGWLLPTFCRCTHRSW